MAREREVKRWVEVVVGRLPKRARAEVERRVVDDEPP